MPTAAQIQADREMQATLDRLQEDMRMNWKADSLPPGWNGLDSFDRVAPHKTRVTIRLDADMVRWFRKLGPNYSQRMNDVLRVYWQSLLAGHISAYIGDDPAPRMALTMRVLAERAAARAADKN